MGAFSPADSFVGERLWFLKEGAMMNLPFDGGKGPIAGPGAMIGILGGGQLGRMTALAAARLGYHCHIFCPEENSPASLVSARTTQAAYDDWQALEAFAKSCHLVTYEFENVPLDTAHYVSQYAPLRPGLEALRVAQDRLIEKQFCNDLDIQTAPWADVTGPESLAKAIHHIGRPAILKTARLGYDGKGQIFLPAEAGEEDPDQLWALLLEKAGYADAKNADLQDTGPTAILEGFVDFEKEVSVIIARGLDGQTQCFSLAENQHKNHILDRSLVPARVSPLLCAAAVDIAKRLADHLSLVGLLAVELFVTREGLFVNEMAPRPHNSGHWTMDACRTSQFEQLIRAVCGLPLGSVQRDFNAEMINLIGDYREHWEQTLLNENAKLHLYGKAESRPGRKMGHINLLTERAPIPGVKLGDIDPMGCP